MWVSPTIQSIHFRISNVPPEYSTKHREVTSHLVGSVEYAREPVPAPARCRTTSGRAVPWRRRRCVNEKRGEELPCIDQALRFWRVLHIQFRVPPASTDQVATGPAALPSWSGGPRSRPLSRPAPARPPAELTIPTSAKSLRKVESDIERYRPVVFRLPSQASTRHSV